jgi:hypothetical protein
VKASTLLAIDSAINLALGSLLLIFPAGLVRALGVPGAHSAFYPSLLGAVLVGIGIALWMERKPEAARAAGLGLRGAIAINLAAALVLAIWLIWGSLAIPMRGQLLLWILVFLLIGLSLLELARVRKRVAGGQ